MNHRKQGAFFFVKKRKYRQRKWNYGSFISQRRLQTYCLWAIVIKAGEALPPSELSRERRVLQKCHDYPKLFFNKHIYVLCVKRVGDSTGVHWVLSTPKALTQNDHSQAANFPTYFDEDWEHQQTGIICLPLAIFSKKCHQNLVITVRVNSLTLKHIRH